MEIKETVTGESTILADGIVLALVEQLELLSLNNPLSEILSENSYGRNIEVEVRIGIIKDRDDKRLLLPIEGDALISKRVQTSFSPGVSPSQLKIISNALKADESWVFRGTTQSIDKYFKLPHYDDQVRWSKSLNLETLDCITKTKLATMDVTTGKVFYQDIDDSLSESHSHSSLDYRIAINVETNVNTSELPNENMAVYQRHRTRESFQHKTTGAVIDLTKVTSREINKSVSNIADSCEVEVELNSKKLLNLLKADVPERVVAKRRKLMQYCATLVTAGRSLCALLSSDTNLGIKRSLNIKLCDLRVDRTQDEIDLYKKLINQQEPLIGDYLYRALISNSDELAAGDCYYEDKKPLLDGPFYAKIDENGRKIVVTE